MEKTTIIGGLLYTEAQKIGKKLQEEFSTFHFGISDDKNGMYRVSVEEYCGNALFMNMHYFARGIFSILSS